MTALIAPPDVIAALGAQGIELSGSVWSQQARYLKLLLETNQAFNLTAISEPAEAWPKHIGDSLSLLPELAEIPAGAQVVDVGSGGGLPALPLAIARPDLHFTLVESIGKKAHFLGRAAGELGLTNVEVVQERAESFGQQSGRRERFDVATSRALSRLPVLLELTLPLLRVGGLKLAIKGEQAELEVHEAARALALLGGAVENLRRSPTGTLLRIRKLRATPARYPRAPGEPKRHPLG
jgi:16S rRNA (guanine527-N7)-methyltransferase